MLIISWGFTWPLFNCENSNSGHEVVPVCRIAANKTYGESISASNLEKSITPIFQNTGHMRADFDSILPVYSNTYIMQQETH